MKHSLPITAYTRTQAPCCDVAVTSHYTGSQSETPCVADTETAATVTIDETGCWTECGDIRSSHLLGSGISSTSDVMQTYHVASSSTTFDATSATGSSALNVTSAGDVEYSCVVLPPRLQRTGRRPSTLAHRRARINVDHTQSVNTALCRCQSRLYVDTTLCRCSTLPCLR